MCGISFDHGDVEESLSHIKFGMVEGMTFVMLVLTIVRIIIGIGLCESRDYS